MNVPPSIAEPSEFAQDPPKATVARRAASYSDFYHAVRASLEEDQHAYASHRLRRRARRRSDIEEPPATELEASYNALPDEILDSSHDKYQYVKHSKPEQTRG